MAKQTTSTALTARIPVEDPTGTRHVIEEWTTFIRVEDLAGTVSPPLVQKVAYRMAGRPVHLMEDGSFQTATDAPAVLQQVHPSD